MLHGYLRHHKHTPRRRLRAAGGASPPPRRGGAQPGGTPGPCFPPSHPPHFQLSEPSSAPLAQAVGRSHIAHVSCGRKVEMFSFLPFFCCCCCFRYIKKRTKATGQQRLSPVRTLKGSEPGAGAAGRGAGPGALPPRGPGAGPGSHVALPAASTGPGKPAAKRTRADTKRII